MKKKDKEHLNSPEGWDCYICGQYFKLGRFGRPYVFRDGEWVLTKNTSLALINKAIEARKEGKKSPKIMRHYSARDYRDLSKLEEKEIKKKTKFLATRSLV